MHTPTGESGEVDARHSAAGKVCKPSAQPTMVNPSPATPCGNGPLAAHMRLCGPFFFVPRCVTLQRCMALSCGVHGRIADGNRGQGALRGTVGFARTATDGGRRHGRAHGQGTWRRVYGLTFGAELSVHVPASARCPAGFPGRGDRGRAGAVMARVAVWESVTLAGRAEWARVARTFVGGVLGAGGPASGQDDSSWPPASHSAAPSGNGRWPSLPLPST